MFTKSLPALLLLALAACNGSKPEAPETCPDLPNPEGDVAEVTLPIELVAGDLPLGLGELAQTEAGVPYEVHKLKMYVSEVELFRDDGTHEHALLLDSTANPLAYGVHLVDAADPDSMALSFRAPRGTYTGMRFTIGVPSTCPDLETPLNHVDASEMQPPLDIDSDMYWTWDPGYVFFKIEGRAGEEHAAFFYHVGEDARLVQIELDGDVIVDDATSTALVFDVNRVFVTPEGEPSPRLDGDREDREAHSGPIVDQVKQNLERSSVLSLR